MRCDICGRVLRDAQGKLTEAQSAEEISKGVDGCEGCAADFAAAVAQRKPVQVTVTLEEGGVTTMDEPEGATEPVYTVEQAFAIARNAHMAREEAAFNAKMKAQWQAIAAGKNPITGGDLVEGFPGEVDAAKAAAAEILTKLDEQAKSPGQAFKEKLGLE